MPLQPTHQYSVDPEKKTVTLGRTVPQLWFYEEGLPPIVYQDGHWMDASGHPFPENQVPNKCKLQVQEHARAAGLELPDEGYQMKLCPVCGDPTPSGPEMEKHLLTHIPKGAGEIAKSEPAAPRPKRRPAKRKRRAVRNRSRVEEAPELPVAEDLGALA